MDSPHKLKLRSGSPVWFAYPARVPAAEAAGRNFRTDVVVVGAGISGALVAYALSRRGYRVAVLDCRGPLRGSTPASTSLVQFEIDTPLVHLTRMMGAGPANRAWVRSRIAVENLRSLIRSERITAAVASRASVYLAGTLLDPGGLELEARARRRIGLPAEVIGRAALKERFGLVRSAAILSEGNFEANPRALAAAVLRRAQGLGTRLYAPYEVDAMEASRSRVLVHTRQGLEIDAAHVVLCTGYELLKSVPPSGHRIASTWAYATRPQAGRLAPERCLAWEASDPYLYVRTTVDGRVLCGGGDEPFVDEDRRETATAAKIHGLERKLARLMPAINPKSQMHWSGSFGQTPTGLPRIGALPGKRGCYAVMGYGGNGITFSMLAADLLSKAISGGKDPDATLFGFR